MPLRDPDIKDPQLRDNLVGLDQSLDQERRRINALKAPTTAYTPTNVTTDRSYDADATTTDELADVLGTLISDLQAKGILS